jgi:hypothetical protein
MGWFSFEGMGATAGDILARDVVGQWIARTGIPTDVALAPPFVGGVDWRVVSPADYAAIVFVCGPFGNGWPITDVLDRFAHCALFGMGLSLLQPLEEWNPFAFVIVRDSSSESNPDLSIGADLPRAPVVGVIKVHKQSEYGARGMHSRAHALIDELLMERKVARVAIDTRLEENEVGLRSVPEVVSVIGKMDAVVTTRLHGAVLALAQGIPALAIDPIDGGAKVSSQMKTIDWPCVVHIEHANLPTLEEALAYCLSDDAKLRARECTSRARRRIARLESDFITGLRSIVT